MCKVKTYRHQVLCFIHGITKHHTLVASSLVISIRLVNTPVDIHALLMDTGKDSARVTIELVFTLCISDFLDRLTGNGLQVDIGIRVHLTHDHRLSGSYKRLDGTTRLIIVCQELIEQCIGNLVGHLVGMSL